MITSLIELVGIYSADNNPDVSLIELKIDRKANEIDMIEFTQEIENEPTLNWQTAFEEKYLDFEGEVIIGDDFDLPKVLTDKTRLTFFIYFLNLEKPLLTPFGDLQLTEKTEPPERIKKIIFFNNAE